MKGGACGSHLYTRYFQLGTAPGSHSVRNTDKVTPPGSGGRGVAPVLQRPRLCTHRHHRNVIVGSVATVLPFLSTFWGVGFC